MLRGIPSRSQLLRQAKTPQFVQVSGAFSSAARNVTPGPDVLSKVIWETAALSSCATKLGTKSEGATVRAPLGITRALSPADERPPQAQSSSKLEPQNMIPSQRSPDTVRFQGPSTDNCGLT